LKERDGGKILFQPGMTLNHFRLGQKIKVAQGSLGENEGRFGEKFQRGSQAAFGFADALGQGPELSPLTSVNLNQFVRFQVVSGA
jgi:hypothetical protein